MVVELRLREAIKAKLELEWSPEQIAAWMLAEFPDRPCCHVCHETIYQALCTGANGILSRQLTKKRPRFIAPGLLMVPARLWSTSAVASALRPQQQRKEGDLITGRGGRPAIGTLVCRRSRYIKLIHVPGRRTAEDLIVGIREALTDLTESVRFTLTWDQGSEMAGHDQIAALFGEGVFFAHASKPWKRPTNENSNGLLRQYSPRTATYAPTRWRTYAGREAPQHPPPQDA